jgi:hypothetical protein
MAAAPGGGGSAPATPKNTQKGTVNLPPYVPPKPSPPAPNYSAAAHARPPAAAAPAAPAATSDGSFGPNWMSKPYEAMTRSEQAAWNQMQASANAGAAGAGSAASTAAADLAEKQREFDITTQRDVAKQGATELDALQKLLMGLTGPKDPYAYLFNSRGLTTPQGYKPAGVPLTDAQQTGWMKANPGMTAQDLQTQLTGGGVAPNWAQQGGTLGNMPQSMATSNPSVNPQLLQQQAPNAPSPAAPVVPPGQANQGVQNYMQTPAGAANVAGGAPTVPVPSMAGGGQVPGPPGTPSLAVVHGGEQVTPAPGGPPQMPGGAPPQMPPGQGEEGGEGQGQSLMNAPGLHPAIAALVDAVSGLLQNPDFAPFVAGTLQSNKATPGGAPSMATGGTVPPPPGPNTGATTPAPMAANTNTSTGAAPDATAQETFRETGRYAAPSPVAPPPGTPAATQSPMGAAAARAGATPGPAAPPLVGTPLGGAQQVQYNTGVAGPADKPIMPINKMDPYSQALYDVMGRLHPYSAQQEAQMGAAGVSGVQNYVSSVEGMPVTDYTSMVERLKPNKGAPSASTGTNTGGFTFG